MLSFAKTASSAMSLRCHAFITVMQTAELRDCDDPADTRDLPRERTLLVEPQMGPGPMVVTEIRSQGPLQMPGVQDHEMVQAVSSYRADQAFGVGVLPGTPRRVPIEERFDDLLRRPPCGGMLGHIEMQHL